MYCINWKSVEKNNSGTGSIEKIMFENVHFVL